ncbi:unnamed protein product, partial [Symbiodinium sp. CCMP2592]
MPLRLQSCCLFCHGHLLAPAVFAILLSDLCVQVSREVYRRNGFLVGRTQAPIRSKSLSLQSILFAGEVMKAPPITAMRKKPRQYEMAWKTLPERRFVFDPKSSLPVPRGGWDMHDPSWPDIFPTGRRGLAPLPFEQQAAEARLFWPPFDCMTTARNVVNMACKPLHRRWFPEQFRTPQCPRWETLFADPCPSSCSRRFRSSPPSPPEERQKRGAFQDVIVHLLHSGRANVMEELYQVVCDFFASQGRQAAISASLRQMREDQDLNRFRAKLRKILAQHLSPGSLSSIVDADHLNVEEMQAHLYDALSQDVDLEMDMGEHGGTSGYSDMLRMMSVQQQRPPQGTEERPLHERRVMDVQIGTMEEDASWISGDLRRRTRVFNNNQEKLLFFLSEEVTRTPAVFEQAQKNRDAHQKRLNEMLEETLRQIKKCRAHMQQKKKHVMDTTKSYTAKFDHELAGAERGLRRDLTEAFARMNAVVDELGVRMTDAEAALVQQREDRKRHIESTLGPIRDESQRLFDALAAETRERQLQDHKREKILEDEVVEINKLIDEEKFEREQQLMTYERWADAMQQQIAKSQYQLEKQVRDVTKDIRTEHQGQAKSRVETQHAIVDSIASFIHKYREQLDKDVSLQNMYKVSWTHPTDEPTHAPDASKSILLSNLPLTVTESDVRAVLSNGCGEVQDVEMCDGMEDWMESIRRPDGGLDSESTAEDTANCSVSKAASPYTLRYALVEFQDLNAKRRATRKLPRLNGILFKEVLRLKKRKTWKDHIVARPAFPQDARWKRSLILRDLPRLQPSEVLGHVAAGLSANGKQCRLELLNCAAFVQKLSILQRFIVEGKDGNVAADAGSAPGDSSSQTELQNSSNPTWAGQGTALVLRFACFEANSLAAQFSRMPTPTHGHLLIRPAPCAMTVRWFPGSGVLGGLQRGMSISGRPQDLVTVSLESVETSSRKHVRDCLRDVPFADFRQPFGSNTSDEAKIERHRPGVASAGDTPRWRAGLLKSFNLSLEFPESLGTPTDLISGDSYLSRGPRHSKDEGSGKRRVQSVQGAVSTGLPSISEDVRRTGRKKGALSVDGAVDIPDVVRPGSASDNSLSLVSPRQRPSTSGGEDGRRVHDAVLLSSNGEPGSGGASVFSSAEADWRPASSHMRTSLLAKVLRPYTEGSSHLDTVENMEVSQDDDENLRTESTRTLREESDQQSRKLKVRKACTYDANFDRKQKAVVNILLGDERAVAVKDHPSQSDVGKRRQDAAARSRRLKAMLSGAGEDDDPPEAMEVAFAPSTPQPALAEEAYWKTLWEASRSMMEADCPEVSAVKSSDLADWQLLERGLDGPKRWHN